MKIVPTAAMVKDHKPRRGLFWKKQRTGLKAVNDQTAEEHGGDAVTRNAERGQRDHRTAADAVVCRFRGTTPR